MGTAVFFCTPHLLLSVDFTDCVQVKTSPLLRKGRNFLTEQMYKHHLTWNEWSECMCFGIPRQYINEKVNPVYSRDL